MKIRNLREKLELLSSLRDGIKRKPFKAALDSRRGLGSRRNPRVAIRESVKRGVSIIILYKRGQDGAVRRYEVIPLSYRFRHLRKGLRRVLFCQDVRAGGKVKFFLVRNIYKVALTKREVNPRWPVEIA